MMAGKEEVLVSSEDVRVRVLGLGPGEETPWHYHTVVVDHIVCLEGHVVVYKKDPDEEISLRPGERCKIDVMRGHRVVNGGSGGAKYLLIQGVGRYDFNPID